MISFVCRARDEAATLGACLDSVSAVTLPKEVIVILDRCTDDSEAIARAAQARDPSIQIDTRSIPVSRAGLETLITPRDSAHSLTTYAAGCSFRARPGWRFLIGGDFVLGDELVRYLNAGDLGQYDGPTRIRLPALSRDGIRNCEPYLSNCLQAFGKYVFWEVPLFDPNAREVALDLPITHASSLDEIKPYWTEAPWFQDAPGDEARALRGRYAAAVELLGPEPLGAARGSNPACDPYFRRVLEARLELLKHGILFEQ